jgi:hypothetical protein
MCHETGFTMYFTVPSTSMNLMNLKGILCDVMGIASFDPLSNIHKTQPCNQGSNSTKALKAIAIVHSFFAIESEGNLN